MKNHCAYIATIVANVDLSDSATCFLKMKQN